MKSKTDTENVLYTWSMTMETTNSFDSSPCGSLVKMKKNENNVLKNFVQVKKCFYLNQEYVME